MLNLQRYRDGYMAARHQKIPGKVAVYIIGGGHANSLFGVPWYLEQKDPSLKVFSLLLREKDSTSDSKSYDFAIDTMRADREDPCKGMEKHFKKYKKKKS